MSELLKYLEALLHKYHFSDKFYVKILTPILAPILSDPERKLKRIDIFNFFGRPI
jgi:hypothetical protein